jgi:hypothetical protein
MATLESFRPETSTQQRVLFQQALHRQTLVNILQAASRENPTRLLQQYDNDLLLTNRKIFIFETIPLETKLEDQTREILGDSPIIPIVLVAPPAWLESHTLDFNFHATHILADHLFIKNGNEPFAGMLVKRNGSPFLSIDTNGGIQTEWHKIGTDDKGTLYALGLHIENYITNHYTVSKFPVVLRPQWHMLVKPDGSFLSQIDMIRERASLERQIVDLDLLYPHSEEVKTRHRQLSLSVENPEKLLFLIEKNIERLRPTTDEHFQPIRRGKIGTQEFPVLVQQISDGWQLRISNINIPDGNLMEISRPENYDVTGDLVIAIHKKETELSFQRWTEIIDEHGKTHQYNNAETLIGANQILAILSLMEKDAEIPVYIPRILPIKRKKVKKIRNTRRY